MSRIKNDYDFLAGIYFNGLHFNKYRMILNLYTDTDSPQDQNIAFDRINYFLQEVVQCSVFVASDEEAIIAKYQAAGIPVLIVPAPGPYDQVVQATIVTKLNAILEEMLVITESEISSVSGGYVTHIWDSEDEEDEIHELINDESEEMWWASPEPRFISLKDDTEQVLKLTWEKLKLHWYDESEEMPTEIIFTPDPELLKKPMTSDNDETIIKMSDFNKVDEN